MFNKTIRILSRHMTYSEGTHIIFTLDQIEELKLKSMNDFKSFTLDVLNEMKLSVVGYTEHNFDNNGFTISICLKESHICIHTWPEYKLLNMDIYLCNYLNDNTALTHSLYEKFKLYFDGSVRKEIILKR